MKILLLTIVCSLFMAPSLMAQDKNVTKAEEYLQKAKETTNATERRDYINKAVEAYTKAGYGKEMFDLIGDAMVEARDYTSASTYYNRNAENKKAGMGKIADAMLEDAANAANDKDAAKSIKSADSYYRKSDDPKAGYRKIGDYFHKQGADKYNQALNYYIQAGATDMVGKIAGEYRAQGNDTLAAQAYERLDNAEGYNAAAKIYEETGDFGRAYVAYEKAGNMDGLLRFANREFETGNPEAGAAQYNKIADYYLQKEDKAGMTKLAESAFKYGQYQLASELYTKIGDNKKMEMSLVYADLYAFNIDGAIDHAIKAEEEILANAIKANKTLLEAIKKIAEEFETIRSYEPNVTKQYDSNKNLQLSVDDLQMMKGYYTDYKSKITDLTFSLAASYAKLNNDVLKEVVRTKFMSYGAVRNLLDKNMVKKKEKAAVKTEDIFL